MAEYAQNAATTSPQKEYGYRGGQALVVWEGAEPQGRYLQWLVSDHLGTPRMVLDQSGRLLDNSATSSVVEGVKRHDYLPFGEELAASIGPRNVTGAGYVADTIRQKFAGQERDSETGLDFAQSRHFSSVQGRFTRVDSFEPVLEFNQIGLIQITSSPQSWNKYAYAYNNPLKYVDQNGKIGHIAAGIIAGAVFGAGSELIKQGIDHYLHGTPYDGRKILVAGVAGGVAGGLAALTFGVSIAGATVIGAVESQTTRVGAIAVAKVVQGGIERGFDGDPETDVLDLPSIAVDAVAGGLGGHIGEKFADGFMKSSIQAGRMAVLRDQLAHANRMANGGGTAAARVAGRVLISQTQAQIKGAKEAVGIYAGVSELFGRPAEEATKGVVEGKTRPGLNSNTCGQNGNPLCVKVTGDQ